MLDEIGRISDHRKPRSDMRMVVLILLAEKGGKAIIAHTQRRYLHLIVKSLEGVLSNPFVGVNYFLPAPGPWSSSAWLCSLA
jgi:hypothetical protein